MSKKKALRSTRHRVRRQQQKSARDLKMQNRRRAQEQIETKMHLERVYTVVIGDTEAPDKLVVTNDGIRPLRDVLSGKTTSKRFTWTQAVKYARNRMNFDVLNPQDKSIQRFYPPHGAQLEYNNGADVKAYDVLHVSDLD